MQSFWASEFAHPRQRRYEARRVRDVLKAFDFEKDVPNLLGKNQERTGERRLTFETFHDYFPTFPYVLEAQSFFNTDPDDNKYTRLSAWLTQFHKTFVFDRYLQVLQRYEFLCDTSGSRLHRPIPFFQRGLPLGMIFPWQGTKKGLIIHNGEQVSISSAFVHHFVLNGQRRMCLVVEPFRAWLGKVVQSGWTPETPPRERAKNDLHAIDLSSLPRWFGFASTTRMQPVFLPGCSEFLTLLFRAGHVRLDLGRKESFVQPRLTKRSRMRRA